ncbi:cation diffusion facilitator family transporter [Virgibacillus subterraneus]|uniref:Cation diffusion facilitator family transporter n=2 Tax=Virgibacillus TaxID=84406 RepID=A0A1H1DIB6_9BACI|nr:MULTISPECIES: cation diffusion facilitator family transporter [Virgibacillus]SDQ76245.1 cation diffusion facilitator family transporter [Virgibacillus salinus]SEQ92389.1 cation diffusion facilitator family transporter [Virgibacillus subterraneus]
MGFMERMKKGNTSSGLAALGNAFLALIKGVAAFFSGNGAMFATTMHSLADSVNQGFVFFGSVLAESPPSDRFPTGFGRVINIFCMVAVIVVSVLAYETLKEGWHLFQHPKGSGNLWLNIGVLIASLVIDGAILIKAMKEIIKESKGEQSGWLITSAFKSAGKASPATRLVFYEDLVATSGAVFAMIGVLLSQVFGLLTADGIFTMLIGILMLFVAFRVGYDNMVGLIGVSAPADVENKLTDVLLDDEAVVDIYKIRTIQEGRTYHVEGTVELKKGFSLAEADDIKFSLSDKLLRLPEVADVVLGIIEDNGEKDQKTR